MKRRVYAAPSKAGKKRKVVAKRRLPHLPSPHRRAPSRLRRLLQWVALGLKTTLLYVENGVGLNPAIVLRLGYVFNLIHCTIPTPVELDISRPGLIQLIAIYEQFVVYGVQIPYSSCKLGNFLEAIHELPLLISPVQ